MSRGDSDLCRVSLALPEDRVGHRWMQVRAMRRTQSTRTLVGCRPRAAASQHMAQGRLTKVKLQLWTARGCRCLFLNRTQLVALMVGRFLGFSLSASIRYPPVVKRRSIGHGAFFIKCKPIYFKCLHEHILTVPLKLDLEHVGPLGLQARQSCRSPLVVGIQSTPCASQSAVRGTSMGIRPECTRVTCAGTWNVVVWGGGELFSCR